MSVLSLFFAILAYSKLVTALFVTKWLDKAKETLLRLSTTPSVRDYKWPLVWLLWLSFCTTIMVIRDDSTVKFVRRRIIRLKTISLFRLVVWHLWDTWAFVDVLVMKTFKPSQKSLLRTPSDWTLWLWLTSWTWTIFMTMTTWIITHLLRIY